MDGGWGLNSGFEGCNNKSGTFLKGLLPNYKLVPEPGCKEIGFRPISLMCLFYNLNEAHKKYSLLDTQFDNIFDFGVPGKHLY